MESLNSKSVAIVGGGIIGIACAHYLKQSGFDVQVLDRGQIGGQCSKANCGYVSPSHVLPLTVPAAIPMAARSMLDPSSPFKIKFRWDRSYWSWMAQFAKRCRENVALAAGHHLESILEASIGEYRRLLPTENIECEFRESGLLNVFETQAALAAARRENEMVLNEYGHAAKDLTAEELVQLEPTLKPDLAGGLFHERDASLRPDLLNQNWKSHLE